MYRVQLREREFGLAMFRYYKYLSHSHSCCQDPVLALSVAMVNTPVHQKLWQTQSLLIHLKTSGQLQKLVAVVRQLRMSQFGN